MSFGHVYGWSSTVAHLYNALWLQLPLSMLDTKLDRHFCFLSRSIVLYGYGLLHLKELIKNCQYL